MLTSILLQSEDTGLLLLSEKLQNMTSALNNAAIYVASEISKNFNQGGRPKWSGGKILHKTGKLKQIATSITVADNRAEIGGELNNLPYSAVHQFGGKNIPARPYMNLPDGWRQNVINEFKTVIMGVSNDTI